MDAKLTLDDELQAFIHAYRCNFSSGETKMDYYCGITDDLTRREKEHNATFVKKISTDSFKSAKDLEQALHEAGFDTGKQVGNGNEDSVFVYMYKKIPGVTKE